MATLRTIWRTALAVALTVLLTGPWPALRAEASIPVRLSDTQQSEILVQEARRLIVDALPEDREKAESLLLEAIRVNPQNVDAYAELSRFVLWQVSMRYLKPFHLSQAATLSRHVKEMAPRRPLGNYLVAEMMIALGQNKEAIDLHEQTRAAFPNHPDTLTFDARFYSVQNPQRSVSSAIQALSQGVSMDTLSPAITAAFETISGEDRRFLAESLVKFSAVYPDRWLSHRAALAYAESDDYKSAARYYLKAIAQGNEVESRLHLGVLQYEKLGKPLASISTLEKLIEVLQIRERRRSNAISLVNSHLALAHLGADQPQQAADSATRTFMESPEESSLIASLIDEFESRGQLSLLEPGLRKLALVNPLLDYVHIALAQLSSKREQSEQAVTHLSSAIAVSPDRDDLYAARGLARYKLQAFASALADFERAVTMSPEEGAHHYNRACMLSLLGREEEALSSLKAAILLDGTFVELAKKDDDLKALRVHQDSASELAELGVLTSPSKAQILTEGHISQSGEVRAESHANQVEFDLQPAAVFGHPPIE